MKSKLARKGTTVNSKLYLRRYLDISTLIYSLSNQCVTFLDPQSWDDRNDAYYLQKYKEKKKLKALLVLCFTQGPERFHYWKAFAPGTGGVCVEFCRKPLVSAAQEAKLKSGSMKYIALKNRGRNPSVNRLPFTKRVGFKDEREYRIIYESSRGDEKAHDFSIPISYIHRVILSPQMHPALVESITNLLRSIEGCADLSISHSDLIDSAEWQNIADSASL